MKHNLMLVIPYGGVGGMERLAFNMYRYYQSIGYTVKVVKLVGQPGDIVNFGDDEIVLSRRDLVEMSPFRRCLFYLSIPLSLARVVWTHGITHSIAFGDMANLFSSLSPSWEYKVASLHSLKSVELAPRTTLNRLFRLAYRSSYRRFKRVVAISRAIRADLIANCGYAFPGNLTVVYNPHDVHGIREAASVPLETDARPLFPGKTVVFLGRLAGPKAPWHLVRAFRAVLNRGLQARLLMIGDGDEGITRYLVSLVEAYGISAHVTFLGRKQNPYHYLVRADVLALSSHFEWTPNVIVEAIALGVPVVSSHCTDGVLEMMTTREFSHNAMPADTLLELEAGVVTPPLTGGCDEITPETPLTPAEQVFADALAAVLVNPEYRTRLMQHRDALLAKFDMARSAQAYLEPLTQVAKSP